MPRVKTYDQQQVAARPSNTPYQQISTTAADFGGAEAEALARTGDRLMETSNRIDKRVIAEQDEINAIEAQAHLNEANKRLNDYLYNPESGALTRKSADSFAVPKETEDFIRKTREDLTLRASNPAVRRSLEVALDKLGISTLELAQRHTFGEVQKYKGEVIGNAKTTALESVALNPFDENLYNTKRREILSASYAGNKIEGISGDAALSGARIREDLSKLNASRVVAMARTDRPADIKKAYEAYQQYDKAGEIAIEERAKLENFFDAALPKAVSEEAFGAIVSKNPVRDAAGRAAMVGMDPKFLAVLTYIESGGRADAKNPNSSAQGFYQWTDATARQYGLLGDGFDYRGDQDKELAALAKFTEDNRKEFVRLVGREPTPAELYLAHQQGAAGAARLLANPNMPATDIVGTEQVLLNGGDEMMTAGEFAKKWIDQYNSVSVSAAIGATGVDMTAVHEQAAALEEQTPGAGALLIARAEKYNNDIETARAQNAKVTKEQALDLLDEHGYDLSALPSQTIAAAKEARVWEDVVKYAAQGGVDDPDAATELDLMTPDQLAQADLSQYPTLSRAQREAYAKKQRELADPANKHMADKIDSVIAYKWQSVYGNNPLEQGASKDDKNKFARFKNFVVQEVAILREAGKTPGNKELAEITDRLLTNRAIDPPGLLNRVSADIYQIDIDEIPETDRSLIEEALIAVNRPVTEEAVISIYATKQREKLIAN